MENVLTKTLTETLEDLKKGKPHFEDVAEELFRYNYEDFNHLFGISKTHILQRTYDRLPVFKNENCVAILMLWGINNKTAIHDHKNYDGKIKVLKGNLTEIFYKETNDFIEYEGQGIANEGVIFSEDFGGIHSIVNNDATFSVSLHIYQTPQLNLNGVRIFDIENKKWAILNDKATSCSWNLPKDAYKDIFSL